MQALTGHHSLADRSLLLQRLRRDWVAIINHEPCQTVLSHSHDSWAGAAGYY